jgi:hypothetical protein
LLVNIFVCFRLAIFISSSGFTHLPSVFDILMYRSKAPRDIFGPFRWMQRLPARFIEHVLCHDHGRFNWNLSNNQPVPSYATGCENSPVTELPLVGFRFPLITARCTATFMRVNCPRHAPRREMHPRFAQTQHSEYPLRISFFFLSCKSDVTTQWLRCEV